MYRLKFLLTIGLTIGVVSAAPMSALALGTNTSNLTNDGSTNYELELAADRDWVSYERINTSGNSRELVARNIKTGEVRMIDTTNDTSSLNIHISNNIVTYDLSDGT